MAAGGNVSPLLAAFKELRACIEQETDSLFCAGFATPRMPKKQDWEKNGEYVAWTEVRLLSLTELGRSPCRRLPGPNDA